mmetsp:Transcript_4299/g.7317  ORF Transcript_4299/g.7317 Transcript_4299/m.7317 type:complete len:296 (-) Transcript_4299:2142-3029(-)
MCPRMQRVQCLVLPMKSCYLARKVVIIRLQLQLLWLEPCSVMIQPRIKTLPISNQKQNLNRIYHRLCLVVRVLPRLHLIWARASRAKEREVSSNEMQKLEQGRHKYLKTFLHVISKHLRHRSLRLLYSNQTYKNQSKRQTPIQTLHLEQLLSHIRRIKINLHLHLYPRLILFHLIHRCRKIRLCIHLPLWTWSKVRMRTIIKYLHQPLWVSILAPLVVRPRVDLREVRRKIDGQMRRLRLKRRHQVITLLRVPPPPIYLAFIPVLLKTTQPQAFHKPTSQKNFPNLRIMKKWMRE